MTILACWKCRPNDSLPTVLQLLMVVLRIYLVHPYTQVYLVIHCKLSRICIRYIYELNLCSNDLTVSKRDLNEFQHNSLRTLVFESPRCTLDPMLFLDLNHEAYIVLCKLACDSFMLKTGRKYIFLYNIH